MRFVVTGGCGYIGAAVVRTLVERGDHVLNIDSRRKAAPVPALASLAGRESHVRLESTIKDATMLRALFHEFKPDRVIHLASSADPDPQRLFELEVATALAVLGASRDYAARLNGAAKASFRIVQAVRTPRPASAGATPRILAQRAAEGLLVHWSQANDLPLVTCMADEVFGPWQPADGLLPRLCLNAQTQTRTDLAMDGMTVRDFLPIADFAAGIVLAADRGAPHACYEFSAGTERRDLDVVEAAIAILDKRRPRRAGSWLEFVQRTGRPPSDGFSPMLDPTRAERDLKWTPGSFYDGLGRFAAWVLSQWDAAQAPAPPLASAAE